MKTITSNIFTSTFLTFMYKSQWRLLNCQALISRIIFLFLFLVFSRGADDDDSASMAKLAAALNPLPPNWSTNSSSSYCEWQGVGCNGSRRVVHLNLTSMSLCGSLPSEFPPFHFLEVLKVPHNLFTGSIPSLRKLPLLKELRLGLNNFRRIPPGFFQGLSTHLQVLTLSDNPSLSTWKIPKSFKRLKGLQAFNADNTNLAGSIPDIFDSLPLTHLNLEYNYLTGPINILSNMTYLSKVILGFNQVSGPILDLSNCKTLESLELPYNYLTGIVPRSLVSHESHPRLQRIDLAHNKLQGPFPSFIPENIIAVLDANNFCTTTGNSCDSQVSRLLEIASAVRYPYKLSLAWKGNDACKNWTFVTCDSKKNITKIDLGNQQLTGTIFPAFANLTSLQYLYLNENNLTGPIPDSLTTLPHLLLLDVSNNNLSGVIPSFPPTVKLNTAGNQMLVSNNVTGVPDGTPPTGSTLNFPPKGRKGYIKVIVIISGILGTMFMGVIFFFIGRRIAKSTERKRRSEKFKKEESRSELFSIGDKFQELQLFDFAKLATATNKFHPTNKLGKGGFGLVYKGKLQDGQEIAVKRLAKASLQGLEEFMNEAVVISKLQHRNLVRLLGCCIDGDEKMLVYEFMPNKSLDVFLFDLQKQKLLDWRKRFNIIEGISRGLLYLHRDSRLRIIHRDLKASNILLDEELNPKISDFGIAKIFGGNESQANTRRVFGTYGYMSPEYAMKGQFPEKSDVFSFGVLTLEIVSGRRNSNFHDDENSLGLLAYAWKLWNEDNILALVDPLILSDIQSFHKEISRCIHVGLLCVQNFVKDRPTMSTVAMMLSSEIENLPAPKEPPFIEEKTAMDHSQTWQILSLTKICQGHSF